MKNQPMPVSERPRPAQENPRTVNTGTTSDIRTTTVDWHRRSTDEVLEQLAAPPQGLTPTEATARLATYGPNELVEGARKGPLGLILDQLKAVMVLILIAAGVLSLLLGKVLEASAIGAIVALFTILGFLQEYRAEQAIAALRRLAVPVVRVRRGGEIVEVPAGALVPGDIVLLEAGNVVPADLRILESASLRAQEAALTGESEPIDKTTGAIDRDGLALGDRTNLAYSGTQITHGRGAGVVVATGMQTEIGRIASLLQSVEAEATPLQERLDRVGKQLALLGVAVAAIVVVMGAIAGEPLSDLVLTAISVTVAVVPEGLPAVVTFTLAIGAQRMLRRNALIRKLPAVETLGSVTVICTDKTGTLTQNRMTVTTFGLAGHTIAGTPAYASQPDAYALALVAGLLCNDGQILPAAAGTDRSTEDTDEPPTLGDPTETALLVAAHRAGVDVIGLRETLARIGERPFDSERKRMSTVHGPLGPDAPEPVACLPRDTALVFVKGALDGLLARASHVWHDGAAVVLDDEHRAELTAANDRLASDGMRVLGMAYRTLDAATAPATAADDSIDIETDLTILGLVGIIDPPRPEVRDAVSTCATAGIRVVMITGDHPVTAGAIAADLGISTAGGVTTGAALDALDDAAFAARVHACSVFARVSPEHKLRIVQALRDAGDIVAMTGDGVNDAPALKQAHIGVAMGITGTDVSKEASEMVLRDDNFATIVGAVEEGRVIYDNLRRFVKFAVAGNIGKILVMVGWPLPFLIAGGEVDDAVALLPLQLLWLNLMTDGLLGLSLGVEPAERGVMRRAPNDPEAGIWAGGLGRQATWTGLLIGAVALGFGFAYHAADLPEWQTMIFTSLAVMQVFQALGTRSTTASLRTIGLRTNPLLLGFVALVLALQVVAVTTPVRDFLDLERLDVVDFGLCVIAGAALLAVLEAEKWFRRRASVPVAGRNGPA